MNIYVGNLDYKVNEEELQELFEEYGSVSSSKIIMDKFSGRSKGFGFVEMDSDDEANEAITNLDGTVMNDREITVNKAKPRKTSY
ncbi:MAG: RNA-binding protein [Bacteroidales bacterium]|nr:RNA-binding protein [Bacteroidales bacterium]